MYAEKSRQYKESIVESFYNCPMDGPVIVTTLAGPDFDRVINLADEMLQPIEINSYEIDEATFRSQEAKHSFLPERIQGITNIYLNDVNKAMVSNFMDIDLMGSVLTQKKTVQNILNQQKYLLGTKCFIGTFSLRPTGLATTFRQITNMIGLTLKSRVSISHSLESSLHGGYWKYCKKHVTNCDRRISEFDVYHYSDKEGPMVTFRLIYK